VKLISKAITHAYKNAKLRSFITIIFLYNNGCTGASAEDEGSGDKI